MLQNMPWVLGGHWIFSHSIDPSWKNINNTTIAYIKPMAKLVQTLKNSMWHLSNGRHQLKGRKSFLKNSARAGLAQSLFEGLVLLGVKPIRLQVNLCFHHSFSYFLIWMTDVLHTLVNSCWTHSCSSIPFYFVAWKSKYWTLSSQWAQSFNWKHGNYWVGTSRCNTRCIHACLSSHRTPSMREHLQNGVTIVEILLITNWLPMACTSETDVLLRGVG